MYTNENDVITMDATIKSAYHQKKEAGGEMVIRNVVTAIPDDKEIFTELEPVFKNVGKKFTPSWFKGKEHIIMRSLYDIPVKGVDDETLTFDEWLEKGLVKNAKGKVRFILKKGEDGEYSGVIYPSAIRIVEDGEPYNPFEGM